MTCMMGLPTESKNFVAPQRSAAAQIRRSRVGPCAPHLQGFGELCQARLCRIFHRSLRDGRAKIGAEPHGWRTERGQEWRSAAAARCCGKWLVHGSTDEVAEQGRLCDRGGDGGKGPGQGEHGSAKRDPDTAPGSCAQCARPCTSSSNEGQKSEVHSAPAPRHARSASRCVRCARAPRRRRSRQNDLGGVRGGTRGSPRRTPRAVHRG